MSDIMRPIPFSQLMNWIIEEHKTQGAVFGVRKMVTTNQEGALPIFDERIETPFGPAAGPNTQLAQNIVASYVAGSRFFELKTVQVMDGEELSKCVNKPCLYQPPLHPGGRRVLQLRVVDRARGSAGLCRVREGMVCLPPDCPRVWSGQPGRLCLQHVRGL